MLELIDNEAKNAARGKTGYIFAKMNSLVEPQVIQALYRASQAGVKVDLVVRGVCALRPGIKGISSNIRVRSIIGRFLEHTRVFHFENDGDPKLYLSSADWMGRNFFNRVETCFPIEDPAIQKRILAECRLYLTDNCQAWQLGADGRYQLVQTSATARKSAQETLLAEISGDQ
jgi:polyphosphate kinase